MMLWTLEESMRAWDGGRERDGEPELRDVKGSTRSCGRVVQASVITVIGQRDTDRRTNSV